ncbi:Tellurite resistance protein TerB [Gemmobacter aquatilis]|uniref:Tellurite resistance protein TerB n=1 Tax=Gemmobacter aquatilis TaxID=933059 RepID=A0A1H8KQD8_9RHOB|nr:TerB family tellurite resistance protein [Gemmobacter aquatilis]SEN95104.1 Tellurite resistance protein TerB [Gemmobacter aquatilis]
MSFLKWLFGRAGKATEAPPPIILRGDSHELPPLVDLDKEDDPDLLPDDDADDDAALPDILAEIITPAQTEVAPPKPKSKRDKGEPLENLYCEIEYSDATGKLTRRAITMLSLKQEGDATQIYALCHMRKAQRCFRCDRIVNVITADGEVMDGATFLRDILCIDFIQPDPKPKKTAPMVITAKAAQDEPPTPRGKPGRKPGPARNIRDAIMPQLAVLVTCAKSDGQFHAAEIDRIMSYAESEAIHLQRSGALDCELTIEMADNLAKALATMRPQARTLERNILAVLALPDAARARFKRALDGVIMADGDLHEGEAQFLRDFDDLALRSRYDLAGATEEVLAAAQD